MIVRVTALVVLWVALQGEATVGNLVGGILVVAGIEVMFPMARHSPHRLHPWGALRFVGRLMSDLVVSSWHVVVAVLRPDADRTHTAVLQVDLDTPSRLVASLVANAITLTPGTMTVDIEPTDTGHRLGVHILGRVDPDEFRDQVRALERRVQAAVSVSPRPVEGPSSSDGATEVPR